MPDLWPFHPEDGVLEAFRWFTDVIRTSTTEDRYSLAEPRMSIGLSFVLTGEDFAKAAGLIEANPHGDWYLPDWMGATISGAVTALDTTLTVNTDADYREGGLAVVWEAHDSFTLVTIASVGSGEITLTGAVGASYTSPVVAPVLQAYAPNGIEITREYANRVTASMRFHVRDTFSTESNPYATYDGLSVLTERSLAVSPITGRIAQTVDLVDNGLGPVVVEPMRDVLETTYGFNFQDESITAKMDRRKWLNALRGRDTPFWMSSGAREMIAQAPISSVDTTITVRPIFATAAENVGQHLSIDGTIFREITGAAEVGSDHVLTLDSAVGADLTDPEIGILRKWRLDTDLIEVDHRGPRAFGAGTLKEVLE